MNVSTGVLKAKPVRTIMQSCADVGRRTISVLRNGFSIVPKNRFATAEPTTHNEERSRATKAFRKDGASVMVKFPIATNLNKKVRALSLLTHSTAHEDYMRLNILSIVFDRHRVIKEGGLYARALRRNAALQPVQKTGRLPLRIFVTSVNVPYNRFTDSEIHNRVSIVYRASDTHGFVKPVMYGLWPSFIPKGKSRSLQISDKYEGTVYVRQSARNRVYLTFRRSNKTDDYWLNKKITLAYWLSWALRWKDIVLLYEKESQKYDESASVLFEKLVDDSYDNVFFVIDKESSQSDLIAEKYRGQVLYKHTLKHYMYFFIARKFAGTEMPAHSLDLRVANKHAVRKIHNDKLRYVFLQHGVMYMVSLASETRKAARKFGGDLPSFSRTVVSSQAEADHFIEHGDYRQEDLYVCGLPKFDRAKQRPGADKIVIMPTWRPWEYNQVRTAPQETRYHKMIEEIIAGVPQHLHDKIVLLPHPLFLRELKESTLSPYIKEIVSYSDAMMDAALLITDYSSIAYDAFYRGANVVFWWKEKDYCMEQYGGFLMLDEHNAFGDIVHDTSALSQSIDKRYRSKQLKGHTKKFQKLVAHSDGRNTDRLITMLKQDKII